MLQLKKLEDEMYRRRWRSHEEQRSLVFECMWQHRQMPGIESVVPMFSGFNLDEGCPQLHRMGKRAARLYSCLCESRTQEVELARKAAERARASESAADMESSVALKGGDGDGDDGGNEPRGRINRLRASMASPGAEVAHDVVKELLYRHMKSRPGFDALIKSLMTEMSRDVPGLEAAARAREQAIAGSASNGDSGQDASRIAPITPITEELLTRCLDPLTSASVQQNIRAAFTTSSGSVDSGSTGANGCALLSMASSKLLRDVHACLCRGGRPPIPPDASGLVQQIGFGDGAGGV